MKEKEFNLEKEYNKLKGKFSLPNFQDMNNEFELSNVGDTEFLLRAIRRKITEKINDFSHILEGFIYPNSASLPNFYEMKFLESERETMTDLFKHLMILRRENLKLDLESNDKEEAEFIKYIYEEWLDIKKKLLPIVDIMRESWKMKEDLPTEDGFFG